MQWKPGAQQQSLLMIRLYLFTQGSFCSITTWCQATARRSIWGLLWEARPAITWVHFSFQQVWQVAWRLSSMMQSWTRLKVKTPASKLLFFLPPFCLSSFFFFRILTKLSWLFLNKTRLQDCLVKETDWSAVTVSLDLYIEQNPYPTWAHNEPRTNPGCKLLLKAVMQLAALCERRQSCSFPTVAAERCCVSISNEHCVPLCGLLSWHGALAQKMMCTLVGNWCEVPSARPSRLDHVGLQSHSCVSCVERINSEVHVSLLHGAVLPCPLLVFHIKIVD